MKCILEICFSLMSPFPLRCFESEFFSLRKFYISDNYTSCGGEVGGEGARNKRDGVGGLEDLTFNSQGAVEDILFDTLK